MIETVILSSLIGAILGAIIHNIVVNSKRYCRFKLSDNDAEIFIFDKEFHSSMTNDERSFVGIIKEGKIIGAIALKNSEITDAKIGI